MKMFRILYCKITKFLNWSNSIIKEEEILIKGLQDFYSHKITQIHPRVSINRSWIENIKYSNLDNILGMYEKIINFYCLSNNKISPNEIFNLETMNILKKLNLIRYET